MYKTNRDYSSIAVIEYIETRRTSNSYETNRDYSSTSINKLKREGGEEGNLYEKNGDHSTESAHERFLFTSSDTSNPSELFNASQLVNKNRSSTFHGMMFLFHTY